MSLEVLEDFHRLVVGKIEERSAIDVHLRPTDSQEARKKIYEDGFGSRVDAALSGSLIYLKKSQTPKAWLDWVRAFAYSNWTSEQNLNLLIYKAVYYLKTTADLKTQDLARFDLLIFEALHSPHDQRKIDIASLSETSRMEFQPSLKVFQTAQNIEGIPSSCLIFRRQEQAIVIEESLINLDLLKNLMAGRNLLEAMENLGDQIEAQSLQSLLQRLIQNHLIVGLR